MNEDLVVLGLLQNQWAYRPASVKAMFARNPDRRSMLIWFMLSRSLSGRRLRRAFGDWADRIIWENASPRIAAMASGQMPGDRDHVNATLQKVSPGVVIAFGVIAVQTIAVSCWCGTTIVAPHPAARWQDIDRRLVAARVELDAYARRPTAPAPAGE